MRRSILFMICFVFSFSVLVGCTASTSSEQSPEQSQQESGGLFNRSTPYQGQFEMYDMNLDQYAGWILVDRVTGCEYIRGQASESSYTPRLNADGVPMCKNTKK
ncbi:hypothetical protein PPSQR21_038330 [Paenibacillus polymyxa SQR-21]|uniref:hypothetical protein n=1 Tax=Paenibacillus polymyxa TaxID=1406 RepID=UPI00042E44D4|nr:hypothetical protein [Paenibacillus polymyxa]AHM67471.1 hypothetical protein PPSQR21_038330 [Paenibacillus polymyxa SQR-21]